METDPNTRQVGGDHYMELGVQPWTALEAWMSTPEFLGFLRGNVIKYMSRLGRKHDALEDAKKAHHYLEKYISVVESERFYDDDDPHLS